MCETRYSNDAPTWSNAYLWPPLLRVLGRLAPAPRRVFELGCGNGATARMLAGQGYSVTGVDPSSSGVEIARAHASEHLQIAIGSSDDDLASSYGQYPVVLSLEVIEHCPSARDFMRSFVSLMAPGAIGIISTPYHGYLKNLAVTAAGRFDHHFDPLWEGGHLKFFSHAKLAALFDEFGLKHEFHRIGRIPPLAKSTLSVVYR